MGKNLLHAFSIILTFSVFAQTPIYTVKDLQVNNQIPDGLNESRTAVIVSISPKSRTFLIEGDWKEFSNQVHGYIHKMGIDAVLYVNHNDYFSGNSTRNFYYTVLQGRNIKNLIFVHQNTDGYELLCTNYENDPSLIRQGQQGYKISSTSLNRLMLTFGREVKRAGYIQKNFLIPEKPTYLDGLSIIENTNLKNYPGQIRRNKMGVERFQEFPIPEGASSELQQELDKINRQVQSMNSEMEAILKDYPWEIEFIDYLSDEDLLRRRYQFVLRNIYATGESIRAQLKYQSPSTESGYVSVIPVMPESTSIKTIPKNALVYKFYIKQNIAKNAYVGEWDADETWQDALRNYIGNMIQYFNKGN